MFLIDYFYFDSHLKNENISTFIAAFALLFSIVAAIKLEAWSEKSLNDKAFKQTEKLIEFLSQVQVHNFELEVQLEKLASLISLTQKENVAATVTQIDNIAKVASSKMIDTLSVVISLSMWRCTLSENSSKKLKEISVAQTSIHEDIVKIRSLYSNTFVMHQLSGTIKNSIDSIDKCKFLFTDFFSIPYEECFIHKNAK